MPVLIATPGANDANSFLTEAEASVLLDERLDTDAWTSASVEDRERALIWSTRLLNNSFEWAGRIL